LFPKFVPKNTDVPAMHKGERVQGRDHVP